MYIYVYVHMYEIIDVYLYIIYTCRERYIYRDKYIIYIYIYGHVYIDVSDMSLYPYPHIDDPLRQPVAGAGEAQRRVGGRVRRVARVDERASARPDRDSPKPHTASSACCSCAVGTPHRRSAILSYTSEQTLQMHYIIQGFFNCSSESSIPHRSSCRAARGRKYRKFAFVSARHAKSARTRRKHRTCDARSPAARQMS